MGGSLGASAAEHQGHGGPVLIDMDGIHTLAHPGDCNGITGGIKAVDGKAVGMFRSPCLLGLGPQGRRKQEGGYCCECAPASIPQAASMSSPLEALIVHTIPWLFNRFLNSSIRISGAHS